MMEVVVAEGDDVLDCVVTGDDCNDDPGDLLPDLRYDWTKKLQNMTQNKSACGQPMIKRIFGRLQSLFNAR